MINEKKSTSLPQLNSTDDRANRREEIEVVHGFFMTQSRLE